MSLLPIKTPSEIYQDLLTTLVTQVARSLNSAAGMATVQYGEFWKLPTDYLLAVLNDDPARSMTILQANTQLAAAINPILDLVDDAAFAERVPSVMGRSDIVWDSESGTFVLLPEPSEEEPEL